MVGIEWNDFTAAVAVIAVFQWIIGFITGAWTVYKWHTFKELIRRFLE